MAMSTAQQTSKIIRVPGVVGGEPIIRGTRIPVRCIVIEYQEAEGDIHMVRRAYPQLSKSTIREALAFYERHREEIDGAIERNEQVATMGG